jgi:hypothetical protein
VVLLPEALLLTLTEAVEDRLPLGGGGCQSCSGTLRRWGWRCLCLSLLGCQRALA